MESWTTCVLNLKLSPLNVMFIPHSASHTWGGFLNIFLNVASLRSVPPASLVAPTMPNFSFSIRPLSMPGLCFGYAIHVEHRECRYWDFRHAPYLMSQSPRETLSQDVLMSRKPALKQLASIWYNQVTISTSSANTGSNLGEEITAPSGNIVGM